MSAWVEVATAAAMAPQSGEEMSACFDVVTATAMAPQGSVLWWIKHSCLLLFVDRSPLIEAAVGIWVEIYEGLNDPFPLS